MPTRRFLVLFIAFLYTTPKASLASPTHPAYFVRVQHFSVREGLPNRNVTSIQHDQHGFAWIGTLTGAYRFDGRRFIPLPSQPRSAKNQLPVYVDQMQTDAKGALWFFEGQDVKHRWARVLLPGKKTPVSPEEYTGYSLPVNVFINAIPIAQRGVLTPMNAPITLFTNAGHIYRQTQSGEFKQVYQHPTTERLLAVYITRTGSLLLVLADAASGHCQLLTIDTAGQVRSRQPLPAYLVPVCTDAQGAIYLYQPTNEEIPARLRPRLINGALRDFLYRLTPQGELAMQPIALSALPDQTGNSYLPPGEVMAYDAYHDLFWYMGKRLFFAWHPIQGVAFDLTHPGSPTLNMSANTSTGLFIDRTGCVWVPLADGFLLLTLVPNRFDRYLNADTDKPTPLKSIRGLVPLGQELWVNSSSSWLVDLKTGAEKQIRTPTPTKKVFPFDQISAVRGVDGSVWSVYGPLNRINYRTQQMESYPLRNNITCWSIWPDGRHNLWLGYDQGLSYFDVAKKQNQPFTNYNGFTELAENRVNGFFPDKQAGGIWVAASSGLYLLDTLRGIVARYSVEQPAPRHLPFNHITFIHSDPDQPGIYWLATRGGGLIRWKRQTGQFRRFTQANGLPNNTLYCLYTDHPDPHQRRNPNRLWFTTDYGLVSFDKRNGNLQTFLPKDGITHEEFNLTSHAQAADGRLFLGGLNGVTAFLPNDMSPDKPTQSPLIVTQYRQLHTDTGDMVDQTAGYQPNQPIQIPASCRAFDLSFALLDYRYLDQTRLWYRILGWQELWTMQSSSDLRINGLSPGNYRLQVRMQNTNSQFVSQILTIPITVQTPVYQQYWFIAGCILLTICLIVIAFNWRNRQLIEEKLRLETEVARRTTQIAADKAIIEQQATDLIASATLKDRFFANVTHEFKTPLTLLLGPITYLAKQNTDFVSRQMIASMDRNARHLQRMVGDLLDLSRIEADQVELTDRRVDLWTVLEPILADFGAQARFNDVILAAQPPQPITIRLDVAKVETVLRNVLANALRFTPSGGQITISVADELQQICVSVKDTGSGIDPIDLPYIFERYYQSRRSDALLQGGTGIGLALCRDYCRLWGGTLTVDSTWGQGSTFSFTYPKRPLPTDLSTTGSDLISRWQKPVLSANQPLGETALAVDSSRDALLLVEDNPDLTVYLQTLLTLRYVVYTCRNGREALAWLVAQPADALPQLIITDMMMPEMDGVGLVGRIREQPLLRSIPVLMLTARADQAVRLQALQLGVADYMTKPFDAEELLARLHNLLERAQERLLWVSQSDRPGELPADGSWIQGIEQLVRQNLADSKFQVTELAEQANMSQRQFYRQIKESTGQSPIQFMQEIRLQTARERLEIHKYETIKEVAFSVGFQKPSYFSELFKNRFGISPASLLRNGA